MPTKYEKKKRYGWLIALIVSTIVISLVFLLIWIYKYRSLAFIIIFAGLNLFGMAALFLLFIQIDRARKERMLRDYAAMDDKKETKVIDLSIKDQTEDQTLELSEDQKILEMKRAIQEKISELKYSGEKKGKKCQITQEEFKENDEVIRCLICGSLFLLDNLVDWLLDHDTCPSCKRSIIEKES